MDAAHPLIATIGLGLVYALIGGTLAALIKLPPIVGYLAAGIMLGPHTPGFVGDQATALELAELGVILLMFGVGLHFSPAELLAVRRVALPGAIVQMATATALGAVVARQWEWSWPAAVVFGLSLSVASTVVLLRALTERGALASPQGRIAVGWLVVEDIVVVVALVLLPGVAGFLGGTPGGLAAAKTEDLAWALGLTVGKFALFAALMIPFGRRAVPWVLVMVAHLKSRELFTLAVLSMAIGIAFLSAKVFGVSFALGAFFAGMVMHGSGMATRAAEQSLPFRDAFAVLFFVAVGMMFDPAILVDDPLAVAATVAIVVLGKSAAAILLMVIFRQPRAVVWTVAAALAQVGELTLVMADQALKLGLLPPQGRDLALSAVLISIALNPLAFLLAGRLARRGAKASTKTKEPAALAAGSVTSSD